MEKEFVPYELAVKLKELGFNKLCMYAWCEMGGFNRYTRERIDIYYTLKTNGNPFGLFSEGHNWNRAIEGSNKNKIQCSAPLWQQSFDWFREKHNLYYSILPLGYNVNAIRVGPLGNLLSYGNNYNYQEARQACLEKLIELISPKK